MFGVDKFLFNNICTYHNIVKNSVKKVIEPNPIAENGPIKREVCFFKNIFNTDDEGIPRSIKARKRLKLEYAIRSKMQLLKSDWMEFLKCSYPELYSHELASEEEESKEVKEVYVHEHVHS